MLPLSTHPRCDIGRRYRLIFACGDDQSAAAGKSKRMEARKVEGDELLILPVSNS
jgi:hypothetical protein